MFDITRQSEVVLAEGALTLGHLLGPLLRLDRDQLAQLARQHRLHETVDTHGGEAR